jgi:hypothetical protein
VDGEITIAAGHSGLKSLFRLGLDLVEQSERTGCALRRQEDHTVPRDQLYCWNGCWSRHRNLVSARSQQATIVAWHNLDN